MGLQVVFCALGLNSTPTLSLAGCICVETGPLFSLAGCDVVCAAPVFSLAGCLCGNTGLPADCRVAGFSLGTLGDLLPPSSPLSPFPASFGVEAAPLGFGSPLSVQSPLDPEQPLACPFCSSSLLLCHRFWVHPLHLFSMIIYEEIQRGKIFKANDHFCSSTRHRHPHSFASVHTHAHIHTRTHTPQTHLIY